MNYILKMKSLKKEKEGLKYVIRVHTCAVPDVPGLKAHSSAAQGETVSPLSTAPPPGF